MIGRVAEIRRLTVLIEKLAGGEGFCLIVRGPPGIGKTHLLETCTTASSDVRVIKSTCDPLMSDQPFGILIDVLSQLDADSPRTQKADRGTPVIAEVLSGHTGSSLSLAEEILSRLERCAMERPTLLLLDDLHWVDRATPQGLLRLGRALHTMPLGVIGAMRPLPKRPELESILSSLPPGFDQEIELGRLEETEVSELASLTMGCDPGPRLVSFLEKAGGNPLFVGEILRVLRDEGHLEKATGVVDTSLAELPSTLRRVIARRLKFLPADTLALTEVASVAGASFSIRELAALAGKDVTEVVPLLTPAMEASVLKDSEGRLSFTHDVVREALYNSVPEATRRELHREAAAKLRSMGASMYRIAGHLMQGTTEGDTEALGWLLDLATEVAPLSPETSVALLNKALKIVPGDSKDRLTILSALIDSHMWTGNPRAAQQTAEEALGYPMSKGQLLTFTAKLIVAMTWQGRVKEAVALTDSATVSADPGEGVAHGRALADISFALGYVDIEAAHFRAQQAFSWSRRTGDDVTAAVSYMAEANTYWFEGCFLDAAEAGARATDIALSDESGEALRRHPRLGLASAQVFLDDLPELERSLQDSIVDGRRYATSLQRAMYHLIHAVTRYLSGEWDAALIEARLGVEHARDSGAFLEAANSYAVWAIIEMRRGNQKAAQEILRAWEADDGSDHYAIAWAQALMLQTSGQLKEASARLGNLWDAEVGRGCLGLAPHFGLDLLEITLSANDTARAEAVAETFHEVAKRTPTHGMKAHAAYARGRVQGTSTDLLSAVTHYEKTWWPYSRARAQENLAVSLLTTDRESARSHLMSAIGVYEHLRAQQDLQRVGGSLRTLGLPHKKRRSQVVLLAGEQVSPTEFRIASMVSEGLTNQEIADALFISKRTVETHIGHLFKKLNLNTRAQLVAAVLKGEQAITREARSDPS